MKFPFTMKVIRKCVSSIQYLLKGNSVRLRLYTSVLHHDCKIKILLSQGQAAPVSRENTTAAQTYATMHHTNINQLLQVFILDSVSEYLSLLVEWICFTCRGTRHRGFMYNEKAEVWRFKVKRFEGWIEVVGVICIEGERCGYLCLSFRFFGWEAALSPQHLLFAVLIVLLLYCIGVSPFELHPSNPAIL